MAELVEGPPTACLFECPPGTSIGEPSEASIGADVGVGGHDVGSTIGHEHGSFRTTGKVPGKEASGAGCPDDDFAVAAFADHDGAFARQVEIGDVVEPAIFLSLK